MLITIVLGWLVMIGVMTFIAVCLEHRDRPKEEKD